MTRVLLTGATGFVGGHVLRRILDHTDWHVVAPHRPGTPWEGPTERVERVPMDLGRVDPVWGATALGPVDVVMNLASDTDIPRAIREPARSLEVNTRLMSTVLEYARKVRPGVFLHMSTNEVYGAGTGAPHREWDSIRPDNPYAAGKAAQEAMAQSWWRTYDVPVVITNTMNPFGPGQPAGKFVPVCLDRIVDGGIVTIQADERGRPASRQYIHAANLADAWIFLARRYLEGDPPPLSGDAFKPDRFNIIGNRMIDNVAMYHALCTAVDSVVGRAAWNDFPESGYLLAPGAPLRPGRDISHALNGDKLDALGWRPPLSFRDALEDTVRHHLAMKESM